MTATTAPWSRSSVHTVRKVGHAVVKDKHGGTGAPVRAGGSGQVAMAARH